MPELSFFDVNCSSVQTKKYQTCPFQEQEISIQAFYWSVSMKTLEWEWISIYINLLYMCP